MRFIDRVRILVRAGDGGNGAVAWRRESHEPMGGPAGGDGGRGGSVILRAQEGMSTLLDLKYQQHYVAKPGGRGLSKSKNGRGAEDLVIRVPAGTIVYYEGEAGEPGDPPPWVRRAREEGRDESDDEMEVVYVVDGMPSGDESDESEDGDDDAQAFEGDAFEEDAFEEDAFDEGEDEAPPTDAELFAGEDDEPWYDGHPEWAVGDAIGDLTEDGEELVVANGGRGGRGNIHFRSSTNRAPDKAEPGSPGEAIWIRLELKLLADVGILGFPNVGKSTLIRRISRSRAEVGAYPFTTLVPQLGVVELSGMRQMVVADVPGLVRGASQGRGLGHDFLRHLERTRVLLHLLSPDPGEGREPLADLEALEEELTAYGDMFEGRPRVVALNKIDTPEGDALLHDLKRVLRRRNIPLFPICAQDGRGVDKLLEALWRRLELVRSREEPASDSAGKKSPFPHP